MIFFNIWVIFFAFNFGYEAASVHALPATVRYAIAANGTSAEAIVEKEKPFSTEIDNFHESIRQRFAILDLRPKDDCPDTNSMRGIRMFYCPTPYPNNLLEWQCVTSDQLCNSIPECPGAEDEDPTLCMFQLASQEQFKQLRKIIIQQSDRIDNMDSNFGYDQDQSDNQFFPSRPASFPFRFRN